MRGSSRQCIYLTALAIFVAAVASVCAHPRHQRHKIHYYPAPAGAIFSNYGSRIVIYQQPSEHRIIADYSGNGQTLFFDEDGKVLNDDASSKAAYRSNVVLEAIEKKLGLTLLPPIWSFEPAPGHKWFFGKECTWPFEDALLLNRTDNRSSGLYFLQPVATPVALNFACPTKVQVMSNLQPVHLSLWRDPFHVGSLLMATDYSSCLRRLDLSGRLISTCTGDTLKIVPLTVIAAQYELFIEDKVDPASVVKNIKESARFWAGSQKLPNNSNKEFR